MGEVQEQRFVCKICSKSCVSGKSLGGHMRIHLAVIAASKKAAKRKSIVKMEFESGDDDQEGSYQSNSEEKIKNCENTDYELRENPKKSWRISDDPKRGLTKSNNGASSCKECGKEFPSLRALSGHMRCHSIKNKELHQCKKCGKDFGSMRAMFGHMKSHSSKKTRTPDESAESLSELENLCPVRRKRSRIRYKSTITPNASASASAFSELMEVEEAASCLMMLSRGVIVRDWLKFETESSYDGSVYFGDESYYRSKKFSRDCGDFVCDADKKMIKNVTEFDDLDSKFVDEDGEKADSEVADDKLLIDFQVSDYGHCASVQESDFEKHLAENEANNVEILKDFRAIKEHECPICFKVFLSGQALGGHKRAHYTGIAESRIQLEAKVVNQVVSEVHHDMFDLNFPVTAADEGGSKSDFGHSLWWVERSHEHEAALVLTN